MISTLPTQVQKDSLQPNKSELANQSHPRAAFASFVSPLVVLNVGHPHSLAARLFSDETPDIKSRAWRLARLHSLSHYPILRDGSGKSILASNIYTPGNGISLSVNRLWRVAQSTARAPKDLNSGSRLRWFPLQHSSRCSQIYPSKVPSTPLFVPLPRS